MPCGHVICGRCTRRTPKPLCCAKELEERFREPWAEFIEEELERRRRDWDGDEEIGCDFDVNSEPEEEDRFRALERVNGFC